MARLHEYQGKALLASHGLAVPRGGPADSADQVRAIAEQLGTPVVLKIQAWTTGRAALGGIAFAETPKEAAEHAQRLLEMRVGQFPVTHVLVEERLPIRHEFFVSLSIDDRLRQPVLLVSSAGGTDIEKRARQVHRLPCDVETGPDAAAIDKALADSELDASDRQAIASAITRIFETAQATEARSLEINPLVLTNDGKVVAADCRITIDDYAVFRHPNLGIDIARELDHPPTALERVAYRVEQEDHRGTFYFAQLATEAAEGSRGLAGFHGAGGGGSMMSMDAITNEGFTIANFTDTSGNPSAAKVYRAARIILAQSGLCGYFGSGSGVASQEQFWSAYGLAKAFWELELNVPAVIRLGGNSEDRAIEILEDSCRGLAATVEGYRKDDPPAKVARRFAELVTQSGGRTWRKRLPRAPRFMAMKGAISFPIHGGSVVFNSKLWSQAKPIVDRFAPNLFRDEEQRPVPAVHEQDLANKDSELIACEVECRRANLDAVFVQLSIPGLGSLIGGGI